MRGSDTSFFAPELHPIYDSPSNPQLPNYRGYAFGSRSPPNLYEDLLAPPRRCRPPAGNDSSSSNADAPSTPHGTQFSKIEQLPYTVNALDVCKISGSEASKETPSTTPPQAQPSRRKRWIAGLRRMVGGSKKNLDGGSSSPGGSSPSGSSGCLVSAEAASREDVFVRVMCERAGKPVKFKAGEKILDWAKVRAHLVGCRGACETVRQRYREHGIGHGDA